MPSRHDNLDGCASMQPSYAMTMHLLWVMVDVSDARIALCIATYLLPRETAHRLMRAHDNPV